MSLSDNVVEIVKALIPPKTNDLEEQQRWRWVVFTLLTGIWALFSMHVSLAAGWLPQLSPGYAYATDTEMIKSRLDAILVFNLEREMRVKAHELCKEREEPRRNELNDDISKLQREYYGVANNQYYVIPRCDLL